MNNDISYRALFGIVLPSGKCIGGDLTRKQACDAIVWMPPGSKIDPPVPPANPVALTVLDALCDGSNDESRNASQ